MPIGEGYECNTGFPGEYFLLEGREGGETLGLSGFAIDVKAKLLDSVVVKKWRCSHGHKWESAARTTMFEIHWGNVVSPPIDLDSACAYCFVELLREKCGTVREDV